MAGQIECVIVDDHDLDVVVRLNGRRVAYANCIRDGDRLKLADIKVDDAHQRSGIGSRLLRFLLHAADLNGVVEVWGVVTADDLQRWPGLLDWYQRHGFVVTDPDADADGGPVAIAKIVRRR